MSESNAARADRGPSETQTPPSSSSSTAQAALRSEVPAHHNGAPAALEHQRSAAAQGSPVVDLAALQPNEAAGYLMLSPTHWTNLCQQAEALVKGGALPRSIDTPEKAAAIGLKGIEMSIPFFSALAGMRLIDGEVCLLGKLALRLIQQRAVPQGGVCDPIAVPPEEQKRRAGWLMGRPGRQPQEYWFTIENAQNAGLCRIRNKRGEWIDAPAWKNYPERMLRWRALAYGANFEFADVLQGCYIAEELEHKDPQWIDAQLVSAGHAPAHEQRPSFYDKPGPQRAEIGKQHEAAERLAERVTAYADAAFESKDGESEDDRAQRYRAFKRGVWKGILNKFLPDGAEKPTAEEAEEMVRYLTVQIDDKKRNG